MFTDIIKIAPCSSRGGQATNSYLKDVNTCLPKPNDIDLKISGYLEGDSCTASFSQPFLSDVTIGYASD